MNKDELDDWMHASDNERTKTIQSWNTANKDGKEIVGRVATLFKNECVYNVRETSISVQDGKWVVEAFAETDDYETLKDRYNVEFLGFKIVFRHMDTYSN
jgi:hypothetical protein